MNYWLTTHWPQREDVADRFSNMGAWVPNGKQDVLSDMMPGDRLFVYESKTGKTMIETMADGNIRRVHCKQGKQGIIALAEILDSPAEVQGSTEETYSDQTRTWWRFKAPAQVINSRGFVAKRTLAALLGYSEDYPFHGFGDKKSGVKRLTEQEYASIHSAFLEAQPDMPIASQSNRPAHRATGGEGPFHESLKDYIANDPEEALNEAGLLTIQKEYSFVTGDRIDVLLKDKDGRPVTVEVEVDCDDTEVAGPLQCMKYRALIAYYSGWRVNEVRTVLAARSVTPAIKSRCRDYEIQVNEIPQWPGLPK